MNGESAGPGMVQEKKSKTWILGVGCGCGCFVVAAAVVTTILLLRGCGSPPPVTPAAGESTYTNSKEGLTGDRLTRYVDFTLNYPNTWKLIAKAKDSPNFVDLRLVKGGILAENFVIGNYSDPTASVSDTQTSGVLNQNLKTVGIPNLKKISEGGITIGEYKGYELLAESTISPPQDGLSRIYLRMVAVRNRGLSSTGVLMLMSGTNLSPELKSAADLGRVGDMKTMVDSFRFK